MLARVIGDPDSLSEIEVLPAGAKIKLEIAALWNIYQGRRARMEYVDGVEEQTIATRYADGSGIEERYSLLDRYSSALKTGHAQSARVIIEQPEVTARIVVDEQDEVAVYIQERRAKDWTVLEDTTEIDQVLFEFFHRSLVAAQKHADRSDDERAHADADAYAMLLERYPLLANRSATE